MSSAAVRARGFVTVFAALLALSAAMLVPAPDGAFAAGLVASAVVIIVASTVALSQVVLAGIQVGTRTRAVLERMVPRSAQSDPDARGHARPRAPGALLPAV